MAAATGYLGTYLQGGTQASNFAFLTPRRFFAEQEMFYTNIYFHINKRCLSEGKSVRAIKPPEIELRVVSLPPTTRRIKVPR